MSKLVFATGNIHKYQEVQQLMPHHALSNLCDLEIDSPAETGLSFIENAILKARHACKHTKKPAFADDSGLIVPSLAGQPGLYSARFAGPNAGDKENIKKLLNLFNDKPNSSRNAYFICVIAMLQDELDPTPIIVEGRWHGKILVNATGHNGFGYDPIFWVPTHQCSAAELPPAVKQQISHRGQAIQQLLAKI